uniref:Uncharacterized protein n=1 Tax=Rhizophora mucronata TaxID=61149 RepID=A0A2P2JGG7_RHIMU
MGGKNFMVSNFLLGIYSYDFGHWKFLYDQYIYEFPGILSIQILLLWWITSVQCFCFVQLPCFLVLNAL